MNFRGTQPRLGTYVVAWAGLLLLNCVTHTSSVVIRTVGEPGHACEIAREVAARVATEFRMRNASPPGVDPSVLPSGSVVLARFMANRRADPQLPGSGNTVYLTVFARQECREISFAITDYDDSEETDYVHQMRSRLTELAHESQPDADISTKEAIMRTLPP